MEPDGHATRLQRTDRKQDYIHPTDQKFLEDVLSKIGPNEPAPHYVVQNFRTFRREHTLSEASETESNKGSVADLQRTDDVLFDLRIDDNIVKELYEHIEVPVNVSLSELRNVEHIADGTYCSLYSATLNGRKLAIKRVKLGSVHEAEAAADIEREFVLLNQIRHPGIVRLLGAGRDEHHNRFLVLEYLPGPLLSEKTGSRREPQREGVWFKRFLQNRGFEFHEAVRHGLNLASALYYLHSEAFYQHRCIHRDLKPDNISFDADGNIKIFDFGLAKLIEAWPSKQNTLFKMTGETGTARYMCPEVALHRPYNEKCDVYSFGILLWEMASGKLPFKGMSREDFYQQVVLEGVRPTLYAKWPTAFHEILQGCWAADPAHRMPFREVHRALQALMEQLDKLRDSAPPSLREIRPFDAGETAEHRRARPHGASVDWVTSLEAVPRLYSANSTETHSRATSAHYTIKKYRSMSF